MSRYTIPTEQARAAVKPTPLVDVLRSLKDNGLIQSFEIVGADLHIEADQSTELAVAFEDATAFPVPFGAHRQNVPRGETSERPYKLGRSDDHRLGGSVRQTYVGANSPAKLNFETKRAYYEQAQAFVGTTAFRRLSPHKRAIWRLHAQGRSKYEIADELCCPSGSVARAIGAIRPLAGLDRATRPQKRRTS